MKDRGGLTYPEVGETLALIEGHGNWPRAYRRVQQQQHVGQGPEAYSRLAEGVLSWGIQRGAGLSVSAGPRVVPSGRVRSGFGVGTLRLPVPCEVVWTREPAAAVALPEGGFRPQWAGFGYGSLPGHPATGEEAFVARLEADGAVTFQVLAFSRPAGLAFRLGTPVTVLMQRLVTSRYFEAATRLAAGT
ncbi:MAG: hypothetical protein JWO93_122 [Micrococcaceae bacterium]|jgi:uncharacterized protein (UPF0548 family)|nr:hypothetical protein [Micrococcaceae bacterium]